MVGLVSGTLGQTTETVGAVTDVVDPVVEVVAEVVPAAPQTAAGDGTGIIQTTVIEPVVDLVEPLTEPVEAAVSTVMTETPATELAATDEPAASSESNEPVGSIDEVLANSVTVPVTDLIANLTGQSTGESTESTGTLGDALAVVETVTEPVVETVTEPVVEETTSGLGAALETVGGSPSQKSKRSRPLRSPPKWRTRWRPSRHHCSEVCSATLSRRSPML